MRTGASGCRAPLTRSLRAYMEESDQLNASAALSQAGTRYPLNRWPSWLQSRCGRFGKEKAFLPLSGNEPRFLVPPARGLSIPPAAVSVQCVCDVTGLCHRVIRISD